MGTDNIKKECYITVVHDSVSPYGRMVNSYSSEQEALDHIKFQKENLGNTSSWNILHIKDCEWVNPKV